MLIAKSAIPNEYKHNTHCKTHIFIIEMRTPGQNDTLTVGNPTP